MNSPRLLVPSLVFGLSRQKGILVEKSAKPLDSPRPKMLILFSPGIGLSGVPSTDRRPDLNRGSDGWTGSWGYSERGGRTRTERTPDRFPGGSGPNHWKKVWPRP